MDKRYIPSKLFVEQGIGIPSSDLALHHIFLLFQYDYSCHNPHHLMHTIKFFLQKVKQKHVRKILDEICKKIQNRNNQQHYPFSKHSKKLKKMISESRIVNLFFKSERRSLVDGNPSIIHNISFGFST